ncbi:hypothetical protein J6590_073665 [Homalodisca vitripennis]|nr:hypothetical protein J6590_073665 [Homalodisca vitripennis]
MITNPICIESCLAAQASECVVHRVCALVFDVLTYLLTPSAGATTLHGSWPGESVVSIGVCPRRPLSNFLLQSFLGQQPHRLSISSEVFPWALY